MTKKLFTIFIMAFFFCTNHAAFAEFLAFKVGDAASYTVYQKINSDLEFFGAETNSRSDATIAFDLKIISSNPETLSYPFEVEVIMKEIHICESQKDGNKSMFRYDSNGKSKQDKKLHKELDKLINQPLIFQVEGDFQIREITGCLAQIEESFDSPSSMGLFGTTQWSFELLLTQIFHLSGENLFKKKVYPASCYQFLHWEDAALDENEINLKQSSAYTINHLDSKKIEASWQGKAKVNGLEDEMRGDVAVSGTVTWNPANPLIQNRHLSVKIEETHDGFFIKGQAKMFVEQTWHSMPL